jgi:hypothetical protein
LDGRSMEGAVVKKDAHAEGRSHGHPGSRKK